MDSTCPTTQHVKKPSRLKQLHVLEARPESSAYRLIYSVRSLLVFVHNSVLSSLLPQLYAISTTALWVATLVHANTGWCSFCWNQLSEIASGMEYAIEGV